MNTYQLPPIPGLHRYAGKHEAGNVRIESQTFRRTETKVELQQSCGRISQLSGDKPRQHEKAGEVGLPVETGAVVEDTFCRDGQLDNRSTNLLRKDFQLSRRNSNCS